MVTLGRFAPSTVLRGSTGFRVFHNLLIVLVGFCQLATNLETGFLCVVLEPALAIDQGGLNLTEIHLPLPSEDWD